MEARLSLKQMILNAIENQPRGYAETLAPIAGYAKGGALKKPLKEKDRDFDNFNGLVNLVKFLFPNEEKILLEEYSKTLDPCNKSARIMLEYLSCNRLLDSMKELIDRMLECNNKESREWAKIYSLQHEWQTDFYGLDFNTLLNRLNEFKTKYVELNVFISILKCNCYYKNRMYKMSFELSHGIQQSLNALKEEYIISSYGVKFNEIMSYLSLRVFNEPDKAIEYAQNVLKFNVGQTFNAYAHYIIGCSHLFTNYEKSREHLCMSSNIYTSLNRKDAADNVNEEIELLDIVWEKKIFSVYYNKEYKYYWLVKNKNTINEDIESLNLEAPFYNLIKGIKENNTNLILLSMILFVKNGDLFLANLPKFELLNRGHDENIVKELLHMYVA